MEIRQLNPGACRTYMFGHPSGPEVVIIDPVLDHLRDYLDILEYEGLVLKCVIDTHTHADHISCGPALKDTTSCDYLMHELGPAQCSNRRVADGTTEDVLPAMPFTFIHTPGHTRDSVCVVVGGVVFTGDTLFLDDGGAGRDDLPGGDPGAHFDSLQKLVALPGNTLVYPAHEYRGSQPSTLDAQREKNPHLAHETKEGFVSYVEDLKLGPAEWMKDVLRANYTCATDPGAAWIPVDSPSCEVQGTLDIGANAQQAVPITVEELKELIAHGGDDVVLIDVREPVELEAELGRIDGVENIPLLDLVRTLDTLREWEGKAKVIICRSGGRAYTAAQLMQQAGLTDVKVLDGGMLAWRGV